jgi:cytidine deaminase
MTMNISYNIIRKAAEVSRKSNVIRSRVGAVLFTKKGHIIASACNRRYDGNKRLTIHAEAAVIAKAVKLRAKQRMDQLFVLVVRTKKASTGICMAKPCLNCAKLLEKSGFITFYSDNDGKIQQLKK